MPSEKILQEKKRVVEELKEKINGAAGGVLVNYQGITVEQDTKLRMEMRKAGADYFVVKNTLARLAVKECGLEGLAEDLVNMTAIAVSASDPVAPAKILSEYAGKIETFNIKAGFIDGQVIDEEQVKELAKLPSKEVLIAKMLGGLNAPISGLVNVLNGNIVGLVRALKAIADQKEGA